MHKVGGATDWCFCLPFSLKISELKKRGRERRERMIAYKVTRIRKQACCSRIWSERKWLIERELLQLLERRNNWRGRWRKELVKEAGQGGVRNTSGEGCIRKGEWQERGEIWKRRRVGRHHVSWSPCFPRTGHRIASGSEWYRGWVECFKREVQV